MRKPSRAGVTGAALVAALAVAALPGTALGAPSLTGGISERLSLSSSGAHGNDWSNYAVLSADGGIAAFSSNSTNLVAGDTNGKEDVFVRDRAAGTTVRISLAHNGSQSPAGANDPSISRDGRYVAFHSESPLTPGDANGKTDVFVKDRQTGALERITSPRGAAFSPTISGNGRYVVVSATQVDFAPHNTVPDLYMYDRETGLTERITTPAAGGENTVGGDISRATVSNDGRYVSYMTGSKVILPHPNNPWNVFVWDRQTKATERVNVSSSGATQYGYQWMSEPGMSDDGRYVSWHTVADNLVAGDTNNASDVFVRDRQTGTTKRVNVAHNGGQSMPAGDPYGCPTCDWGEGVSVSADGRYITYQLDAEDLVPNDTNGKQDLFQYDQQTGTTKRINLSQTGQQTGTYYGVDLQRAQSVTPDGRHYAFKSSDDLLPGNSNSNVMELFFGSRHQ